jgi:hypothetical protein
MGLRQVHRQGVSRNKARVAEAARGLIQIEARVGFGLRTIRT